MRNEKKTMPSKIACIDFYQIANGFIAKLQLQCKGCLSNTRIVVCDNEIRLQDLTCKFCGCLIEIDNRKISEVIEKKKTEKMKIPVEETIQIPESRHEGEIVGIEERKEPYHYIDVVVTVNDVERKDGKPQTLKIGLPYYMSETSLLGSFCKKMGLKVVEGKAVELDDLLGKKLSYTTTNEPSKKNPDTKYAQVNFKSIEPL